MTARPPNKIKRRVGRPRNAPAQSLLAVLKAKPRDFQIYNFFIAYRIAHPGSGGKEAAIAATEEAFHCSRSAVQRRIKQLEQWGPIIDEGVKLLLGLKPSTPTTGYDSSHYDGLQERLAVFYSPDVVAELTISLGAPTALKIAEKCEELQALSALPAIQARSRKKRAR